MLLTSHSEFLEEANKLIWGGVTKEEVFQRWCQGFVFSADEPSALQQEDGGPCAVIAAVQAAILRDILFKRRLNLPNLQDIDNVDLLVNALVAILNLVVPASNRYILVYWDEDGGVPDGSCRAGEGSHCPNPEVKSDAREGEVDGIDNEAEATIQKVFFSQLRVLEVENYEELSGRLLSLTSQLQSRFGVLSFLYSVLLTHGIDRARLSMADDMEPVIDHVHGHASQALLNLLITGSATPHLFDNGHDLGGYAMTGICQQPPTGFLTVLEAMRYCEVGWNLKNPRYPVWIIASETHMTVLCSPEESLIQETSGTSSDSPASVLRRADLEFKRRGPMDDAGFIPADQLGDLLAALGLCAEKEYVQLMQSRLDPEVLGIILKEPFLHEFYADELAKLEAQTRLPANWLLCHYNGLSRSNLGNKVRYRWGNAVLHDILEMGKDAPPYARDHSPMQQCLLTKWPTISVEWDQECQSPSLN